MPASFPGSFQAKSAASSSSATPRLPRLKTSSKKRQTRALFFSSSDTRASSSSLPTCVCPTGRHHEHDAIWRPPAHRLEAYSTKCLEGEFCELRLTGVLGSSAKTDAPNYACWHHDRADTGVTR